MKKILALVMAILMMALVFAGCGSKDTSSDADKKETIVVGYTIYEPMNYEDEDGNLIGYDTDLAKAVFSNLGYDVLFKEIVWDDRYTNLNSGDIDCIWNGFTANSSDSDGVARSEKVDFSYNYMENRQVVVVKKDSGIKAAADLKGKLGAAESGSAGESYAKDFGTTVKGFIKQTDCLFEVKSGTADFAVLDAQLANSYCGKGDYENLVVVEALTSDVEYYAIGFKKGSELTAKVNAELEKLVADGTIDSLAEKYPKVANSVIKDFADQK